MQNESQFKSNLVSNKDVERETVKESQFRNLDPQESQETSRTDLETGSSTFRVKLQIVFAFVTFILLGANDAAIGVLLPHWGDYYNIDKTLLSLIFFAGSIGYLTAALNGNFLSRKLGNVKFLSLGNLAFLSGVFVFCFQPPLYLLLSVPFLLGFGAAILEAALNAHLARLPNKTALLNYLHSFYGIGALLSPFIGSQILEAELSWTLIYIVISAISVSLLISIHWLFTKADEVATTTEPYGENISIESPLKYRFIWLFAFFSLFYAGAEISLGDWGYSFLTQYRSEGTVLSGWLMSGYWFGLTIGRVLIAPLTNKLGSRKIINLCLIGVVSGVLILNIMTFSLTNAFGLLLVGFCLGPVMPTALAFLTNVIPPHLLTGSISFIASLGSLGKAFFPWIAGNIADQAGLEMFLPYIILLTGVMIIFWITVLNQVNQSRMTFQSLTE